MIIIIINWTYHCNGVIKAWMKILVEKMMIYCTFMFNIQINELRDMPLHYTDHTLISWDVVFDIN